MSEVTGDPERDQPRRRSDKPLSFGGPTMRAWMAGAAHGPRAPEGALRFHLGAFALWLGTGAIALGGMAIWLGGFGGDATAAVREAYDGRLAKAGFIAQHFDIRGEARTPRAAIERALLLEPGEVIFHLDPAAARRRIEALDWVRHASVARLLPNRVLVVVAEKAPAALWRAEAGAELKVVDDRGGVIGGADPALFGGLPIVEGAGADRAAPELAAALDGQPEIHRLAAHYVRVGDRRWDVILKTGARAQLPEGAAADGIRRLLSLQTGQDLLALPVEAIDLRASGVVLRERPPARPAKPGRGA